MGRTLRTFVALRVGPGPARRLHAEGERLSALEPALRTVAEPDLHLTVQFLGDTDETEVHRVSRALEGAVSGTAPLAVVYRGLGAFPDPRRARVVWVGVETPGDPGALERLATAVGGALEPLGFPPEARRFHAHVTLARLRRAPAAGLVERIEAEAERELAEDLLSDLELILSAPGNRGYSYIRLTSIPLLGARGSGEEPG